MCRTCFAVVPVASSPDGSAQWASKVGGRIPVAAERDRQPVPVTSPRRSESVVKVWSGLQNGSPGFSLSSAQTAKW